MSAENYEPMPQPELGVLLSAITIANRYQNVMEADEDNPFVYTESAKRKDRRTLAFACKKFLKSLTPNGKEVITMACKKCAKAKPAPKKVAAKPCKGKCKK